MDHVYTNSGNAPLLALLERPASILDVGCGAGDNARLVKSTYPNCTIQGITHSEAEAEIAGRWMQKCWVIDIESALPPALAEMRFDAIVFSHVLEHLRDPASTLKAFSALLNAGGTVLIAVPNVLSWRMRLQFLRGNFEYTSEGILDETHLRFFTYRTAQTLLSKTPLRLETKAVTGSIPLWWLRRYFLPKRWAERIDTLCCRRWPNLFGEQVIIKATSGCRSDADQIGTDRIL